MQQNLSSGFQTTNQPVGLHKLATCKGLKSQEIETRGFLPSSLHKNNGADQPTQ